MRPIYQHYDKGLNLSFGQSISRSTSDQNTVDGRSGGGGKDKTARHTSCPSFPVCKSGVHSIDFVFLLRWPFLGVCLLTVLLVFSSLKGRARDSGEVQLNYFVEAGTRSVQLSCTERRSSRMNIATRYELQGNGIIIPSPDVQCFSITLGPGEGAAASGRGRYVDAARHCVGAPCAGEWSRVMSSRAESGEVEG